MQNYGIGADKLGNSVSAVESAKVNLEKSIAHARERFDILYKRLTPVLALVPTECVSKKEPVGPSNIPLVADLELLTLQVNSFCDQIIYTTEQLAL